MNAESLRPFEAPAYAIVAGDLMCGPSPDSPLVVVNHVLDRSKDVVVCYQIVKGVNKGVKKSIVFLKEQVVTIFYP